MGEYKISFVLQARMGSTRLPKKMAMIFFDNKTILELILSKLNKTFPTIPKYLATSINSDDDILANLASKNNCMVYRGNENDVLSRFTGVAKENDITNIIRICCDNPFLDMLEMKRLINYAEQFNDVDYISFKVNNLPSIKTHFGFWAEFITVSALNKITSYTNEALFHEHVTNYIYENENLFFVKFLDVSKSLEGKKDIRMTIDTIADFDLLSEIYLKIFNDMGDEFTIIDIISFLDRNEEYKFKMKEQIELNSK